MKKEDLKNKFEKEFSNQFCSVDFKDGYKCVHFYKNPAMYLKSINAFGQGEDYFYGRVEGNKFIEEEPKFQYVLDKPLTEEEFNILFS